MALKTKKLDIEDRLEDYTREIENRGAVQGKNAGRKHSKSHFVEKKSFSKVCLMHSAAHYDTLQHTAAHCNTLQHTATFIFPMTHV